MGHWIDDDLTADSSDEQTEDSYISDDEDSSSEVEEEKSDTSKVSAYTSSIQDTDRLTHTTSLSCMRVEERRSKTGYLGHGTANDEQEGKLVEEKLNCRSWKVESNETAFITSSLRKAI